MEPASAFPGAPSGTGSGGGFVVPSHELVLAGRRRDLSSTALVMGILNRTPDSFYQHHFDLDDALRRAEQVVEEGGEILDVGGVKAGAGPEVSVQEEIDRVCPVIEAVTDRFGVVVSVDTFRSATARDGIDAGAAMVNDISGLGDPAMVEVVVEGGAALVVTHIQGRPRIPHMPDYRDLVTEVKAFLAEGVARAEAGGVPPGAILIDPGFDLGKTYPQSMVLLRELSCLLDLGKVVLVSTSHKGFLSAAAPLLVDEREEATLAAVAYGFARGARVFRVHQVKQAVRACRTMESVMTAAVNDPWVSRWEPRG